MEETKTNFSRTDTKLIKGLAVIFMFMHHLWTFPDRIPLAYPIKWPTPAFKINGWSGIQALGAMGQFCVGLFMFLGGYGLYKQYASGHLNLAKKVGGLYASLWKVFVVFIPIGFLFFSNQTQYCASNLWRCYRTFRTKEFLLNLFAVETTYNPEWWFFIDYLYALFLGYLFIKATERVQDFYKEAFIVSMIVFASIQLFPSLCATYAPLQRVQNSFLCNRLLILNPSTGAFFSGITCAKYKVLDKAKLKTSTKPMWFVLLCSAFSASAVYYLRTISFERAYDFLFAPLFTISILPWLSLPVCRTIFSFIGTHSTTAWLTHSFFCYYFEPFVKLVFCSQNALISLAVLTAITIAVSAVLDFLWKKIPFPVPSRVSL